MNNDKKKDSKGTILAFRKPELDPEILMSINRDNEQPLSLNPIKVGKKLKQNCRITINIPEDEFYKYKEKLIKEKSTFTKDLSKYIKEKIGS